MSRDAGSASEPRRPALVTRWLRIAFGLACVALGTIGIAVPGLPTTVFFILAAGSFAGVSPRLESWVLGLPGIGQAVADYRAGLGMPRRAKQLAVAMLVAGVGLSLWRIESGWLRVLVAAVGAIGLGWILRIPTRRS